MSTSNNKLLSETRYENTEDYFLIFGDPQQTEMAMLPYRAAINLILKLMEGVKIEYSRTGLPSPLRRIDSRLKTPESIADKIRRRSLPLREQSIYELTDIAGVRIICHHIDDVYWINDYLLDCDGVRVLRKSDYIRFPKSNGYRSLHLILETDVYVLGEYKSVPIEVQIRTTAMDFWAGIEHQVRYKTNRDVPEEIQEQLRECAEIIHDTDMRMQQISRSLSTIEGIPQYDLVSGAANYYYWE